MRAWWILICAGLFEVGWSLGLRYTEGFSRLWPSVLTGLSIVVSMYLLSVAARTLPIGTAYSVWVGIGAIGASVGGAVLFQESLGWPKILCLCGLLVSLIGLKLTS